mmetsp:Transcript_4532/g.12821  ORF Transcript_4532/g.12821 Transcript_4532/m.12821 type:complete len:789 (+) Transcript_4532:99-2465(+)
MLSSVRGLFAGPWVVPAEQPIDLVFFQRVFSTLCRRREFRERLAQDASVAASTHGHPSSAFLWEQDDPVSTIDEAASQDADSQLVPFVEFERAMVRVRRVIHDVSAHDLTKYDVDQDGYVSWFEFCLCCQSHGIRAKLSIAERIFLTLEDSSSSVLGRWVSILVFAAVLVSIFTFVASTVPHGEMQNLCKLASDAGYDETCRPAPKEMFGTADFVCVMFFTVEYGLRLLLSTVVRAELCDRERTRLLEWVTSDEVVHFPSAVQRLLEFVAAPSNLVDLFAIMPWYIEQVSDQGRENAIIQLIRLTRVIRAFRLGRRLEAVIIIVRSLKRSIRAVRVLVLNLILGMLIFGSLMFMAEQGEWDPEKQYFVRVVGTAWDDESRTWQRVMEKSPFDSIPACFWWAIVTATTVGYGDDYTPTTILGKLVAGVTMVWSLCVVALPIGVIGGNFESVWQQYDQEKKREWAMQRKQQAIADQSVGLVDPLISPRTIVLEVWHDSGLPFPDGRGNQGELLGEASCVLDLPPSEAIAGRRIAAQLRPSPMGARRRARGQVSFEYSWSPTRRSDEEALLLGRLQVHAIRADGLEGIDWSGGVSNPYCVVVAKPRSSDDGRPTREARRTQTLLGTTSPSWASCRLSFDFCWTQAGADVAFRTGMQRALAEAEMAPDPTVRHPETPTASQADATVPDTWATATWRVTEVTPVAPSVDESPMLHEKSMSSTSSPCDEDAHARLARRRTSTMQLNNVGPTLPELLVEVDRLKHLVPKLHADVGSVCEDLDSVFAALQRQHKPS